MAAADNLLAIGPIPEELHIPDLRIFFDPAIEGRLFRCFHYRKGGSSSSRIGRAKPQGCQKGMWCLVAASSPAALAEIMERFHEITWKQVLIDVDLPLSLECEVHAFTEDFARRHRHLLSSELHPPPGLPAGNVGTPRSEVLKAIARCQIPASAVSRLLGTQGSLQRSALKSAAVPPPLCWQPSCEDADAGMKIPLSEWPLKQPGKVDTSEIAPLRAVLARRRHSQTQQTRKPSDGSLESRHLPRPLDESDDELEEPHEQAPHHQRNDRMESATGYLHEDIVEDIWDKHDASGLVIYTDAAYWDQNAGGLDERAHDGWDVERHFEGDEQVDADARADTVLGVLRDARDGMLKHRKRPLAASLSSQDTCQHESAAATTEAASQSCSEEEDPASDDAFAEEAGPKRRRKVYGFDALRYGVAGKLMRQWGGSICINPSDTFRAVVEGTVANRTRAGLGWEPPAPERRATSRKEDLQRKNGWNSIGSVFDREHGATADSSAGISSRGRPGSVRGSFHANPNSARKRDDLPRMRFVKASRVEKPAC
mmetsp:Transcript_42241/g.99178  ORF Transcript_42241/g.99178 Transcript_42241/m.99178 type:complete len:541 (+) Transcript_42241:88-1710(+)